MRGSPSLRDTGTVEQIIHQMNNQYQYLTVPDLKCPKCGSDCYIWIEGDMTEALIEPVDKNFLIYCINDCGIVGIMEGKVMLKKKTLKMKSG